MTRFTEPTNCWNQLHHYQWKFVAQLKCNRIINAAPIREDLTHEGDTTVGWVADQVQVSIIKHDEKYFFTNDLSLSMEKLPELYQHRWPIEEVFRFLKMELRVENCQARTKQAQKTHLASCVVLYLIFQKEEQIKKNETMYAVRRLWQMDRPFREKSNQPLW